MNPKKIIVGIIIATVGFLITAIWLSSRTAVAAKSETEASDIQVLAEFDDTRVLVIEDPKRKRVVYLVLREKSPMAIHTAPLE